MNKDEKINKTKITVAVCPGCGYGIYSVAHHDFHRCFCGDTYIDGGFDYVRIGAKELDKVIVITAFISATKQQLYDDWNQNLKTPRKFGSLTPVEVTKKLYRKTPEQIRKNVKLVKRIGI